MQNDENIFSGNYENLQEFKNSFNVHDKKTLETYYRISKKKQSMMIVRRISSNAPQMKILVMSYKFAELKNGIRDAVKNKLSHFTGSISAIKMDPKTIYVFGDLIPKYEGNEFIDPVPKMNKKQNLKLKSYEQLKNIID